VALAIAFIAGNLARSIALRTIHRFAAELGDLTLAVASRAFPFAAAEAGRALDRFIA
jgi:hypothetical protein